MHKLKYVFQRIKEKGWLNMASAFSRTYFGGRGTGMLSNIALAGLKMKRRYRFKIIQIQTLSGCNYRCSFCPVGQVKLPTGKMSMELFNKIISQLKGFNGVIHPYLSNEPLLDKRLVEFCRIAKENTRASVLIQTNGSLLTKELATELVKYSTLVVNDYTVDNNVISKIKEYGIKKNIIFVNRNPDAVLSNRAGNLPTLPQKNLKASCVRPFDQFYVSFDGKVLLCCQDWTAEEVMGDLTQNTIEEVWSNERFSAFRESLLKKDRIGLCSKCDFPGV